MSLVQGWARDVNGRDRDETETRRLQVSRRDRDVEMHVVINAVVNKLTYRPNCCRYCHRVSACFMVYGLLCI